MPSLPTPATNMKKKVIEMGAGIHEWATCLHDGCVDAMFLDNLYEYPGVYVLEWHPLEDGETKAKAIAWEIAQKTGIPIFVEKGD